MSFWCKIGLHKWLYICWPHNPFCGPPYEFYWRGCKRCHKDQYEHHPAGAEWWYTEWRDVDVYDVYEARLRYLRLL